MRMKSGPRPARFAARSLAAFCLLATLGAPAIAEAPVPVIAVIVHPDVPNRDLALGELRRMFLGDRQFWSHDRPVTLLVPAPGSGARAAMLAKIYEKTETQYRHYWIAKVFRAEVASAPRVATGPLMSELLRGIEGAITVVEVSNIPQGARVLKIDGKGVEDRAYPLR